MKRTKLQRVIAEEIGQRLGLAGSGARLTQMLDELSFVSEPVFWSVFCE